MPKQNYSFFFMCSVAAPYVCGLESAALPPDATLPRRIVSKEDWIPYFEKTRYIKEPRQSLKIALDKYWGDAPGVAVDLGAGAGRDTVYLLDQGWNVYAIDSQKRAIDIIHERVQGRQSLKLRTDVVTFGDMALPAKVDLMNASYSLPFCCADEFFKSWTKITDHLNVGGLFVGQFFGLRDAWTWDSTMTFLSHQQVMDLFKNQFEFLYFSQEEGFSMTSDGESITYRHCYHVIAKKV